MQVRSNGTEEAPAGPAVGRMATVTVAAGRSHLQSLCWRGDLALRVTALTTPAWGTADQVHLSHKSCQVPTFTAQGHSGLHPA